jgi:predicted small lipoprotein YifL
VAPNDRHKLMRAAIVGLLVAGLALSACGRKGALEPPPGASASDADLTVDDPVEAEKASKPNRPFILDGIL